MCLLAMCILFLPKQKAKGEEKRKEEQQNDS